MYLISLKKNLKPENNWWGSNIDRTLIYLQLFNKIYIRIIYVLYQIKKFKPKNDMSLQSSSIGNEE